MGRCTTIDPVSAMKFVVVAPSCCLSLCMTSSVVYQRFWIQNSRVFDRQNVSVVELYRHPLRTPSLCYCNGDHPVYFFILCQQPTRYVLRFQPRATLTNPICVCRWSLPWACLCFRHLHYHRLMGTKVALFQYINAIVPARTGRDASLC